MRKYIISALLVVCCSLQAQEVFRQTFLAPFDFPLYLSGNFGELRSSHFHGGLDFKTQGVIGKPVRCIADGYVSRITVSAGGYGNALYVNHPDGYTSVYGHLDDFIPAISSFVKEYQYQHETFTVDISLDSTRFVFKKGDRIAYGGNKGYSFGPHLHMEIRKTATNEPIDPLPFYTQQIKDTKPPLAKSVMFYPRKDKGIVNGQVKKQAFTVTTSGSSHCLSQPIEAWGEIALGLKAYDYMDGTSNTYGVRSVTLYVDSVEVFNSTVDRFSFDENRMINSWADFAEHRLRNSWYMKSFIEPGNTLRILRSDENRGIININEERNYRLTYVLKDLSENTSTYTILVKGTPQNVPVNAFPGKHLLRWNRTTIVQEPGMHLIIPRNMLYDDVVINTSIVYDSSAISFLYKIHDEPVPLHRSCDLILGIRNMPVEDTSKYYIARKDDNRYRYVGGVYEDGFVRASISELGTYRVLADTIPPTIEPLNKANWRRSGTIAFKIGDKQTGIKTYKARINDKFALFEFDLKSGRYSCKPDSRLLTSGTRQKLEIIVEDNRGNVSVVREDFMW